jgi:hypothetical protein
MNDESYDPLLRNLARLSILEPDASRTERIRARCHRAIARRQQAARIAPGASFTQLVLESALVGGLCLIYLSAVVLDVLRLHRLQ